MFHSVLTAMIRTSFATCLGIRIIFQANCSCKWSVTAYVTMSVCLSGAGEADRWLLDHLWAWWSARVETGAGRDQSIYRGQYPSQALLWSVRHCRHIHRHHCSRLQPILKRCSKHCWSCLKSSSLPPYLSTSDIFLPSSSPHTSVPLQPFLRDSLCHWCHFTDPLTCSFLILSFFVTPHRPQRSHLICL